MASRRKTGLAALRQRDQLIVLARVAGEADDRLGAKGGRGPGIGRQLLEHLETAGQHAGREGPHGLEPHGLVGRARGSGGSGPASGPDDRAGASAGRGTGRRAGVFGSARSAATKSSPATSSLGPRFLPSSISSAASVPSKTSRLTLLDPSPSTRAWRYSDSRCSPTHWIAAKRILGSGSDRNLPTSPRAWSSPESRRMSKIPSRWAGLASSASLINSWILSERRSPSRAACWMKGSSDSRALRSVPLPRGSARCRSASARTRGEGSLAMRNSRSEGSSRPSRAATSRTSARSFRSTWHRDLGAHLPGRREDLQREDPGPRVGARRDRTEPGPCSRPRHA